jgi:hypothetical protein
VAEACAAALAAVGRPAEVLDCLALLGGPGARAGHEVFRRILSVPSLYDGFHFSHLRTGSRLARALSEASDRRLVPALAALVDGPAAPSLMVAVFPTGVSAMGRLKADRPELATVAVCTDACAHRMWVHEGVDLYVACSMLAATSIRRYDPLARVAVVPPPVRAAFFAAPTRTEARASLGLPDAEPCVLLTAGGWGLGPLAESAELLGRQGCHVLALAGLNRRLAERLEEVAERCPRVRPIGFTDRVPELIAAADVVVASPGQTCHEARVLRRPLVVLDVVPGHGRENALHEVELGGAALCSPDPANVRAAVRYVLAERPEVAEWPVRSATEWEKEFVGALDGTGLLG